MSHFPALICFIVLTASSAMAQTPAPGAPAATTGGIGAFWWIILLVIVAVAIWYFLRGRTRV